MLQIFLDMSYGSVVDDRGIMDREIDSRIRSLVVSGWDVGDISRELGISEEEVGEFVRSDMERCVRKFVDLREYRMLHAKERLMDMSFGALDVLGQIAFNKDNSPVVREKAAKDILDYTGFTPARKSELVVHRPSAAMDGKFVNSGKRAIAEVVDVEGEGVLIGE